MERITSEDAAIQARRHRVAGHYLRGMTQQEIAAQEGVAQTTVSRDLAQVRRAWRESSVRDFDEAIAQELDRLDLLERDYWRAWERSCQAKTRTKTKTRVGGPQPVQEDSTETETRDGNPAFLDGVVRCVERRCKLLGLDASEDSDGLTPEERLRRIDALLAQHAGRRQPPGEDDAEAADGDV